MLSLHEVVFAWNSVSTDQMSVHVCLYVCIYAQTLQSTVKNA